MTDLRDKAARYWEGNADLWTQQVRAGFDIYRDKLNTPAFLAMLPDITGLEGLDIGCGEGANTRSVARLGARMTGIDVAPTFIRHAQEAEAAEPLGITYRHADAIALPFTDASFDFCTAFMSLMDLPEQDKAFAEAARVLRPGGFLQFSILHPCFAPPVRKTLRDETGKVYAVELASYFEDVYGEVESWWFSPVPKEKRGEIPPFEVPRFHRTLSDWVAMIVGAGLVIEAMGEPRASPELAAAEPHVSDTRVVPLFLHVRARKPAPTG